MSELQPVELEHEGVALVGRIALPEGPGPHPGVLVMANAMGLGKQARESARRLAALGYVAIATDMYGDGAWFETSADAGEKAAPLFRDAELLRRRVVAWHDALAARPDVDAARTAAIGYCFGGKCVLELARTGAEVRAVVSYHGILSTASPAAPGSVKAQVTVYTGSNDHYVPKEQVEDFRAEMVAAGAEWHIMEFGNATHSFTDPNVREIPVAGLVYDPLADAVSWAGTVALLDAVVKRG